MGRSKNYIVTLRQAKGLIEGQFPRLRPLRLARLGQGWDNAAFLANGKFVLRFPIREIAVPLLETEAAVLPMLAGKLPLPVPDPVFLGRKTEDFPWPFMGYAVLKGRTAARVALTNEQRAASAAVLGRFLRALHAIPKSKARRLGAGLDDLKRVDIAHRTAITVPRLRKLARLGLIKNERRLLEILQETRPAPASPVLLHGDPHAGQLLVDTKGKVCAVIDWGDLHVGHPAVDLSIAHTFLPATAHEAFRRAYGPISEPVWLLARFRGIGVMAALAMHAHEHADRAMLKTGLAGLNFICYR